MSNKILSTLTVCFFLLISCNKTPIFLPGERLYGFASASKNGKKWEASAFAEPIKQLPGFIGLSLATFTEDEFLREQKDFYKIPLKIGYYEVKGAINPTTGYTAVEAFYGTLRSDGDVDEDYYFLDENEKSYIVITKYDSTTNTIAGNYRAYFKLRPPKINPNNPDKVRFTDGVFEVKIKQ